MTTDTEKEGTKKRVSRFREREKARNIQIALASARMALGKDVGDSGRALADFLEKQAKQPNLPDDYVSLLGDAVDVLRSKRRR